MYQKKCGILIVLLLLVCCFCLTACETESDTTGEAVGTVTLSIHCENSAAHREQLLEKGEDATIVPEDGIILAATTIDIFPDESACDILRRVAKEQKLHVEFAGSKEAGTTYVKGIHNLYEKDGGSQSGWLGSVNGVFPSVSLEQYQVKDGDVIRFDYTLDFGNDLQDVAQWETAE